MIFGRRWSDLWADVCHYAVDNSTLLSWRQKEEIRIWEGELSAVSVLISHYLLCAENWQYKRPGCFLLLLKLCICSWEADVWAFGVSQKGSFLGWVLMEDREFARTGPSRPRALVVEVWPAWLELGFRSVLMVLTWFLWFSRLTFLLQTFHTHPFIFTVCHFASYFIKKTAAIKPKLCYLVRDP